MTERAERPAGWQLERSGPDAYEEYLVPAMFSPWADRLLDAVAPNPGERVLDVACGTGIVARRAAVRVGEAGSVVGVDANEGMLDVAREATTESRPRIEWRRADAEDLPADDGAFDLVCCQQALQFVSDPVAMLRESRRVLDADGRLGVSVWRPLEYNPGYVVLAGALERHVGEDAAAVMRSPFPEWGAEDVRGWAREAGFDQSTVTIQVGSMRYPSVEAFVRREAASSPLSEPLGALDSALWSELVRDVADGLDEYTDDEGVVFPMETYFLIARR